MRKKSNYIYLLIVGLFFLIRVAGLGPDITNSDAPRWHRRSESFLEALKQGNLSETYQHYQPGVTLMWLNATVKQISLKYQIAAGSENILTLEHSGYYPLIHGLSKSAIVITLTVLFSFQLMFIRKLFGNKAAIIFGIFMALEAYLIGIDRWFHLTSLETYFAFTSVLALLSWIEEKKPGLLLLSAILFALGVFSKLTALVITPVLLVIFLSNKRYKDLLLFGLIVLTSWFAILPALWVDPLKVLYDLYSAVTGAVSGDLRITQLDGFTSKYFYILIGAFKLLPVTLVVFIMSLLRIKKVAVVKNAKYILLYLVVIFLALSFSDKKIDRYAIAMFPAILLIVSIYLSKISNKLMLVLVAIHIISSVFILFAYYPLFSGYYSPLFGETEKALKIGVYENGGEFYAEAARYLNDKEGKIDVFVPNNYEAFSYYFKHWPQRDLTSDTDYIVWSHDIDRKEVITYQGCNEVEKTFDFGENTILYIFKCL